MADKTATFIAPDHYGPVEISRNMTLAQALEAIGQDGESIVKLNGTQKDLTERVVADAIYLVVPGSVAKGGFDGAA